MRVTRRGSSHGNFHFYPNDLIKFEKSGRDYSSSFLIYLKGLSTVHERILHKHLRNSSLRPTQIIVNSLREWEEFNRSLQFVIDTKLQELEQ